MHCLHKGMSRAARSSEQHTTKGIKKMTPKLKMLGLALVAVFAMNAVGASAASAVQLHSNTTSGTTHITGIPQIEGIPNQFDLANGTPVKCTTTVFDATYTGTTTSDLTVTPTYSGCTAAGQKAEINMGGCTYTITTPTLVAPLETKDHYDAVAHIICPAGKEIVINVPTAGCKVFVKAQAAGGVIDLTNITSPEANKDDILIKSTVTATYTTEKGGICGAAGTGNLTGEITAKAYNNALHTEQRDLAIF
jgi:hypothetical protein